MFSPRLDPLLPEAQNNRSKVDTLGHGPAEMDLQSRISAGPWAAHELLDLPHKMAVQHHPKKNRDAKKKKNPFFSHSELNSTRNI